VQVEALDLRMRPRGAFEAADLGVRMCQRHWREIYACHLLVTLPVVALCVATVPIASWLPAPLVFLAKPWIDRTSLFVLSRAAFGQQTRPADVWKAQRSVWWSQLLGTLTWRRLSPWRSFTQPVYQLEGLPMGPRGRRLRVVRGEYRGAAAMVSMAFGAMETLLAIAVISMMFWLAPTENDTGRLWQSLVEDSGIWGFAGPLCYGAVVAFLEPFYVASGFTLYLTRRSELEAWDIEQELRRAFQG
jgi:hypothetical protein